VGLGADLSYTKTRTSGAYESEDESSSNEESKRKEYSNAIRAMMNEQFSESNNLELSYSDDIRKSFEHQQTLEEQVSMQTEKLKRYSDAYSRAESLEFFGESEMFHELENKVGNKLGISNLEAHRMIESNDPKSQEVWDQMVRDFVNNASPSDMKHLRNDLSEENLSAGISEFKDRYNPLIKQNESDLIEQLLSRDDLGEDVKRKVAEVMSKSNFKFENK
jgi:hypothetical protein